MVSFDEIRSFVFIVASVGLLFISRRSLLNVRSHGFFRFFAWESITALILLNVPFWFSNPFSIQQLLSWLLLCASLTVLWQGVLLLRSGKTTDQRTDTELYKFEKTSTLVTTGIYRYIRHPLYASLLFLAWGAFLKDISYYSTVL